VVLDYLSQRRRLLPLLASAYCFHVGGLATGRLMRRTTRLLAVSGSAVPPSLLAELHATSSGLKAACTSAAAEGIEVCRRACGGHGYLESSGLPPLLGTYAQAVTVEGDNALLPQQTSRFLLRAVAGLREGVEAGVPAASLAGLVPASCRYLCHRLCRSRHPLGSGGADPAAAPCGAASACCGAASAEELASFGALQAAFDHRAGRLVLALEALLGRLVAEGRSPHDGGHHHACLHSTLMWRQGWCGATHRRHAWLAPQKLLPIVCNCAGEKVIANTPQA